MRQPGPKAFSLLAWTNVMTSFQVDQQTTYNITRAHDHQIVHVIEFCFRIEVELWMPFETEF